MSAAFYITTPIYYVNARPHLGHAYTTIIADIATRFNTMRGADAFFLTGTDEHGDKVVRAAKAEGLTPRVYVDKISGLFQDLWPELNINNSAFIRTTDPGHIQVVREVLQKIYDAGDIYFSEYEGQYCFGCERFYTDRELVDGKCPDHETEPEIIRESNYFFKMSRYQQWLIDHIQAHPDFIRPERYRNEVLSFLKEPLEDLCISRPKTRLKWGITLPFNKDYVTYVWFDALLNYVSALGYEQGELYAKYWPVAQHVVAKDILKPHGIYWPIMLKSAGIPIYRHLNVHGYWNVDQSKMSKSIGNVVEPLELKNIYGLDAFRYFLAREMVFGLDSNFSEAALVQRINSDLANDLGNLFSRVLAMAHKYYDGVVPEPSAAVEAEFELGIESNAMSAVTEFEQQMQNFAFHNAMKAAWVFIGHLNRYVDLTTPWELAKRKRSRPQLDCVIYNLLEGLRVLSGLIYPVMPQTAVTMQEHLGCDPAARSPEPFFALNTLKQWKQLVPGSQLPKSVTLFPRVDMDKPRPPAGAAVAPATSLELKPEIGIEDFTKVDLRVATVTAAEEIPRAKKLLKLEVDMGERRTIVSGIRSGYSPQDLVGKQVIVVANLKAAKIMGVVSNGMLLAAVEDDHLSLATLDGPAGPGTKIS